MSIDRIPVPDHAEVNAFFPSEYSLSQYVAPDTDFDGGQYDSKYTGELKILMIGTQERYLTMKGGEYFSTGNHPVETLVPLHHFHSAGFEVDIATQSGNHVKFETWAFPSEDQAVKRAHEIYQAKLRKPLALNKIVGDAIGPSSPYCAVFVPGGHGSLNDIPFSEELARILVDFASRGKEIITLCHGPACLLAPHTTLSKNPFEGMTTACFPDSLDDGPNIDMGYIPGKMAWLVGEELEKIGIKLANKDMSGLVHRDRFLLTGDSPLASNALGRLSATTLLEKYRRK